jgi:hypothetical protein
MLVPPMTASNLPEIRLRSARNSADLEAMRGKLPHSGDFNMLLTGPCRVLKPDRSPLCVYLPGQVFKEMTDAYDVLHSLKDERTDNRGDASGTPRITRGDQKRTRSSLVASAVIGAVDPGGIYPFCRLSSWTGLHLPEWESLQPLLHAIDRAFYKHEPKRWHVQYQRIQQVPPEWVVPATVFTTVTVNNTYSSGVHKDKGDLAEGFSTLAVWSEGLTGGTLVFPRWRVGVTMRTGDLLLLDAHEYHGNTVMEGDGERISLVAYMREGMTGCGTWPEEEAKARAYADRRSGVTT